MKSIKKVLITGAGGFIGSHLTDMLNKMNYDVRALVEYNSFNNWGWIEELECKNDLEVVSGDIRDPYLCKEITRDIDVVFHLAALIAIPYSYIAPNSYIKTNVLGTLNMCQASLENNVSKLIHTSTSEVYGTADYVPIDEKHPLKAQSPYSASKIGADSVASSFYTSFQLPLTIARPFNTFGPRQSARAVIPTVITQIASGKKTLSLGDTSPTRDFTYVEDTCRGLVSLMLCKESIGEVVNVGSNNEFSIAQTIEIIKDIMGSNIEIKEDVKRIRPKKSEVFRLCCDNSKIKDLTGFSTELSFEEGLKRTIDWFSDPKNLSVYKTELFNV